MRLWFGRAPDSESKSITVSDHREMRLWEAQKEEIVLQFVPQDATHAEIRLFFEMGRALGANPFLREIFLTKYKSQNGPSKASIILGRDFYRRKAQEQPDYDGHVALPIYENDFFELENGEPRHKSTMNNRGALLGAYCIVRRKGITQPFVAIADLKEYDTGRSLWKQKKATMITKVAEAQGIRGAYQNTFRGTYDEAEIDLGGLGALPEKDVTPEQSDDIPEGFVQPEPQAAPPREEHNCPKCSRKIYPSKFVEGEWYCHAKHGGCGWKGVPGATQSADAPVDESDLLSKLDGYLLEADSPARYTAIAAKWDTLGVTPATHREGMRRIEGALSAFYQAHLERLATDLHAAKDVTDVDDRMVEWANLCDSQKGFAASERKKGMQLCEQAAHALSQVGEERLGVMAGKV